MNNARNTCDSMDHPEPHEPTSAVENVDPFGHVGRVDQVGHIGRGAWSVLACAVMLLGGLISGCSQLRDPNVPEPIQAFDEPQGGGYYELYRPSTYVRDKSWPLLVVCHTGWPFGSPNREIRQWTQIAESHGFIVVAPKLESVRGAARSDAAERAERFLADERHILAVIRHVRAGNRVSDDRVFIYGYDNGAAPALYAGLRNPDVFRAVAVVKPVVNPADLAPVAPRIDFHQPVLVRYPITDTLTGKHGRTCCEWLQTHHGDITQDVGTVRTGVVERAVGFFEYVVAARPFVAVRAFPDDPRRPEQVHFKVRCSFNPTGYDWQFGDDTRSTEAEPIHMYPNPGTYPVTVTLTMPTGRTETRTIDVVIPE